MYQSNPPQAHLHTDIQRRDTPRSWTCPTKSAGFYISNHLSNLGSEISEFATRCDDNLVAWPGCGRIWSVPVTYPVGSPFGVSSEGSKLGSPRTVLFATFTWQTEPQERPVPFEHVWTFGLFVT